jgi:hypothetical protein
MTVITLNTALAFSRTSLKHCPFCAGEAGLFKTQIDDISTSYTAWYVGCKRCLCQGPLGGNGEVGRRNAASLWNLRGLDSDEHNG